MTLLTFSNSSALHRLKHSLIQRYLASFGSGMQFAFHEYQVAKADRSASSFSGKERAVSRSAVA
jgi:hypothetical protein